MDREKVKALATSLQIPGRISTTEQLEEAANILTNQLTKIADETVPKRKPTSNYSTPWWNLTTKRATKEARKAERRWRADRSLLNRQCLNNALKEQKKQISQARTKCWRQAVAAASKDSRKLWALEKWARTRSHTPADLPKIPELQGSDPESPLARTHEDKATVLATRFFPNVQADYTEL